jgi:hypothetical protein
MKFWQKESETSPVVQALLDQLHSKDSQIAALLERQRESNILLKNDQKQLLELRESRDHVSPVNVELFEKSIREESELRAVANKSSFINWLLIISILVLSAGFAYWITVMNDASHKRDIFIDEMQMELAQGRTRMGLNQNLVALFGAHYINPSRTRTRKGVAIGNIGFYIKYRSTV